MQVLVLRGKTQYDHRKDSDSAAVPLPHETGPVLFFARKSKLKRCDRVVPLNGDGVVTVAALGFLLSRVYCRHCANPDVHGDRVSPRRPEELRFQLRSHVDEARVPQQNRCQIQKEDRGHGQVGRDGCFYYLLTLPKCSF